MKKQGILLAAVLTCAGAAGACSSGTDTSDPASSGATPSAAATKVVTPEMIEKYVPTEAEKAAWESDRDRFVDLTLGPLADGGFRPVGSDFPKR